MRILYIEDEVLPNKDCIKAIVSDSSKSKWVTDTNKAFALLDAKLNFQVVLCDCILRDFEKSPNEQYQGGIDFLRQVRRLYVQDCPLLILFSSRQDLPEEQLRACLGIKFG